MSPKLLKFTTILLQILFLSLILNSCATNKLSEEIKKSNSTCETIKTSVEWRYCFTPGSGHKSDEVIYYFHGGDGSEKDWIDPGNYSETIRQNWLKKNLGSPNIVAISFGKMWLLAHRSELPKSGLFEVMQNEVFPYIEKNILKVPIKERILIGESMGGFNAGTFALQNPKLFSKVALLCPSLGISNEFLAQNVKSYINATGALPEYARFLFKTRDEYFSSIEKASAESPLTLIQNLSSAISPSFFVTCGDHDEYGFFLSATEFVKAAKDKNLKITSKPIAGGKHCSVDVESLVVFLN